MTNFSLRIGVLLGSLVSVAVMPLWVRGQTPAGTAHIRFWKTDLRDLPTVRIALKSGAGRKTSSRDVADAGPGFLFDNYVDAAPGRGTLEVYVGADQHPRITLPADFAPGSFSTIFLHAADDPSQPPRMEIIEDPAVSKDPALAQITVRNFAGNLKDVRVSVGDNAKAQFPAGKGFAQMQGLTPAVYPVSTSGTGPDGKPFAWNTEADLKQHRHQTLLIYPDPYGRIRPRLCVDGEALVVPTEEKERSH